MGRREAQQPASRVPVDGSVRRESIRSEEAAGGARGRAGEVESGVGLLNPLPVHHPLDEQPAAQVLRATGT